MDYGVSSPTVRQALRDLPTCFRAYLLTLLSSSYVPAYMHGVESAAAE